MKLKRLEIQGFKSFPEKTEIAFQQGITAIVGPNGSGKSNISDAVRWVLGEQSAKQLRGAKMEDVIFGGTERRKPHAWCEVSLLFDNEDRTLSMDCSEVQITRRVWRSGESEYFLNKAACRLRDITSLFRDTGIGKDGYSLIGQGRIDEILSAKSEERREVFEEAAGIVTYRSRKEEAERRMENTRSNLTRVDDILAELEAQIGPLAKQAEEARKYLVLQERLRSLDLNAFLLHHDRYKEQIAQFEAQIASIDTEIGEKEPELSLLCVQRETSGDKLEALDAEDRALTDSVLEASRAVEMQEGANNVRRERISYAATDQQRETALLKEDSMLADALGAQKKQNALDAEKRRQTFQNATTLLAEKENALQDANREAMRQEAALEEHKAELMRAMNRMSDMKTATVRLTALQQSLSTRLSEAEEATNALKNGRTEMFEACRAAENRLALAKEKLFSMETKAHALDESVHAIAQQHDTMLETLRDQTAARHQAESRLSVLREMERDYEGYQQAVRKALQHARGDRRIHGVVANIIKAPKRFEHAIETVLASALQYIVTEDEHDAKRMIEYLRENRFGRATFLPITTVHSRTLSTFERAALQMPGCIGVASELIQFDPAYQGIIENLLGRTVIAEDLDSGIEIMRRGRHAFRLVTLTGDVMHSGGSMTGGSVQSRMTSLLSREREIAEHASLLSTLDLKLQEIESAIQQLDKQRAECKSARNEMVDCAHQAEIDVAREQAHADNALAELSAHDQRLEQAELQADQIRTNLRDLVEQLSRAEADHEGGELDQAGMQQKGTVLQSTLAQARTKVEALREEVTHARINLATEERELAVIQKEGERIDREDSQLSARRRTREATLSEQAEQLRQDQLSLEQGEKEHAHRLKVLEAARKAQSACQSARQNLFNENRAITSKLEAVRETLSACTEKRHKAELQLVKVQGELKTLQEHIWNEYELTYAGAESFRSNDFNLRESQKEINEIRSEIRAMGSVNVNAIENYALSKERYDHLSEQKNDLLKATADLENIILELLGKMEKRFKMQFAKLNEYFSAAFSLLFGGGHAELKLLDDNDILNCSIDVVAQPPGKKLQLLSLLSGGEKALTAIAILFAMLKLKPTPFCILDEIEAALDEANVANFADYLTVFSETTQFVVVTHRRGTMERCEALYGVAMEEKGVSRMVSVKLSDIGA